MDLRSAFDPSQRHKVGKEKQRRRYGPLNIYIYIYINSFINFKDGCVTSVGAGTKLNSCILSDTPVVYYYSNNRCNAAPSNVINLQYYAY